MIHNIEKTTKTVRESTDFKKDFFDPLERIIRHGKTAPEDGHWMISDETKGVAPVEGEHF